jgi:hypothetical protein
MMAPREFFDHAKAILGEAWVQLLPHMIEAERDWRIQELTHQLRFLAKVHDQDEGGQS